MRADITVPICNLTVQTSVRYAPRLRVAVAIHRRNINYLLTSASTHKQTIEAH